MKVMKHYPIFLVFAFLFLSKAAAATPDALFYPAGEDKTSAHSTVESCYGNPDSLRDNPGRRLFGEVSLLNVCLRARFSSLDVLGNVSPEEFREYDVAANFSLPWALYTQTGWGAGTRLMTSIGALHGAGKTALVASLYSSDCFWQSGWKFHVGYGSGRSLVEQTSFWNAKLRRALPVRPDRRRRYSTLPQDRNRLPVHALLRFRNLWPPQHRCGFSHAGDNLPVLNDQSSPHTPPHACSINSC